MKAIKDLSLNALDEIFQRATKAAKEEADKRRLPTYGVDSKGNLSAPEADKSSEGERKSVVGGRITAS